MTKEGVCRTTMHDTRSVKKKCPLIKGLQSKNRAHKVGQVACLGLRMRPQSGPLCFRIDLSYKSR
jgi:hypothetical protein